MWKILGTLLTLGIGFAITVWQMSPQHHAPYDTWSISDEEALDVAEATLRYQFEQADKNRDARKKKWLVLVYGQSASPEFLARFSKRSNLIDDAGEENLAPGQGALFVIERAERIDVNTIWVTTSTIGVEPFAVGPAKEDLVVVQQDGEWNVDPTQAILPY